MNRPQKSWYPPLYDKTIIRAMQSINNYADTGKNPPSPQACRKLLDWLIYEAASTYDEHFHPGEPDVRDYMLGRRSVGLAIVKLLRIKPDILKSGEN